MSVGKRVMVVDDHFIVRQMLCSLLTSQGFDVWDAEDGGQALQRAQEIRPRSDYPGFRHACDERTRDGSGVESSDATSPVDDCHSA